MASNRIGRINEEIRAELSDILRSVKDPRVSQAMVTITHVDTTSDLRRLPAPRAGQPPEPALHPGAAVYER